MRENLNGVIVIDKPVGPTSFAMVRRARQLTGAKKVGHGGTLDPLASGVLPICFGEGTKVAQFLLDADKEYEATISFGTETDTDDAAGAVTAVRTADHLSEATVAAAMTAFLGPQTQIPPMYSALKRDGRPLYEYARAGETVERQPRKIRILVFVLIGFQPGRPAASGVGAGPEARVRVRCTKGTYIRTLARDLGVALGTAAHLAALRRTRSGPFDLTQSISPEELAGPYLPMVSPADALADLPAIRLAAPWVLAVTQGKHLLWSEIDPLRAPAAEGQAEHQADSLSAGVEGGALTRLLTTTGELVAVARRGPPSEPVRTLRVFGVSDSSDPMSAAGVGPAPGAQARKD